MSAVTANAEYFSRRAANALSLFNRIFEFKKLQRLLQRKRHIEMELCVGLSVLRLYQVGQVVYKIGGVHFRLLGNNGFHGKAKNERFTSSFGGLRQKITPESVPHVQHDCFSSLNQSNH